MDPICHTLVGAALGEAGLKRRTPLAVPTLLVGANLPDVDVAAYFVDPTLALAVRRGWTHGFLALLVLPLALTLVVLAADRVASRIRPGRPSALPREVLLLAGVSILTHPFLDFLNTYGMRWLMPASGRWFYGDTLFIVDPWIWAALLLGVIWSRRRERDDAGFGATIFIARPARWALAGVAVYIALMAGTGVLGRAWVGRTLGQAGIVAEQIMVAPNPVDPTDRTVVVQTRAGYLRATLRLLPPGVRLGPGIQSRHDDHPAAHAAATTRDGSRFLAWSRFPYFVIDSTDARAYFVTIGDARYNAGWASVTVVVEK